MPHWVCYPLGAGARTLIFLFILSRSRGAMLSLKKSIFFDHTIRIGWPYEAGLWRAKRLRVWGAEGAVLNVTVIAGESG